MLRHTSATRLLELGAHLRVIQRLRGHESIRTTTRSTRVSGALVGRTKSPADLGNASMFLYRPGATVDRIRFELPVEASHG